ncbi:MAG: TonB-dependent receptor plug domain-containing protein, partial [Acidobacteria bacterium]|nr:TonB-dependent receptor plug domain-containing protein [Acidobacteriota bacterium]
VRPGTVMKPNIKMSPGLKSEVTVVASPVIDVLSTAISNNISAKTIDELPKGRSWESVVSLAPAVNVENTNTATGISFRGASIVENSYIVDGVDTTAVVTGDSGQNVVVEFVNEVQVKSGFVGADYGGALGGIVNIVTKSGSNDFRGTGNFQFSGSALTESPRPRLRLVPTNTTQAEYVNDPEDSISQFDFGFTAGGPISRDKIWFFGGWMPQYINTDRTVTFVSNRQTGTYTNDIRRNYWMAKVTARPTQSVTLNASAAVSPNNSQGTLPALDGTGATNFDYASRGNKQGKQSYSAGMDWVVSPSFFVNAFAGYLNKTYVDVGVPTADSYTYSTSNIGLLDVPVSYQHTSGWQTSPASFGIWNNDDKRFSVGVTATWSFNAGGRHLLKFGTQYARPETYIKDDAPYEYMYLYWNASTAGQRGTYGYYRIIDIGQDGHVVSNNQAIFVQDAWSFKRVTVNLGLRTEREHLIPYTNAGTPSTDILFGFGDKLAPRFGLSWDVRGNSSWKVYLNTGLFYDLMKQSAARDGFGGGKFKMLYYTLDTYDYTTLHVANPSGRQIMALDFRTPHILDPAIKPARTLDISGGTEFQIGKSLTASIGFVHRQIADAIEDAYILQSTGAYRQVLGNFGQGLMVYPYGNTFPTQPEFVRKYDGVDFQLHKRFSDGWMANVSYAYSRLWGNFDGLADQDTQQSTDVNPNVGLYCDYLEGCYTASGAVDTGRLSTDRPQQFKINASYSFNFGLTAGVFFQAMSGAPVTPNLGVNSALVTHPAGRGGAGRLPSFTQTDLSLNYNVKVTGRVRAGLVFNILNLFNQDTAIRKFQNMLPGQGVITVPKTQYFQGYDYLAYYNALPAASKDPRFLMEDRFQAPRSARISVKFDF